MSDVRVITLGNPFAGDDGAAMAAVELVDRPLELVPAGRPGPRLLDQLSIVVPTVLVDVTQGLGEPGSITTLLLDELSGRIDARAQVSSHGFGPAEALRLAQAVGRSLPPVTFVGIEGLNFDPGSTLSPAVEAALPALARAVEDAVCTLERVTRSSAGEKGKASDA